ncbi:aldehyde dehydrogenase family protein [Pseudonocardia xishanensis]|uniref:aldehyde dehydrogenase (NAD(+)) n=1 Tax=Pseudonocardia xishanensis TaxID=630995 RepID=A0ABP8RV59_9PSEU
MEDRTELYIGGDWVPSLGQSRIEVENPATGEIVATVPSGNAEDVDRAVAAARAAAPGWAAVPTSERAEFLRHIATGIAQRQDELARAVTTEMGCPITVATRVQTWLPRAVLTTTADTLDAYAFETEIGNSLVVREPAGVVGAITPWNYPLHQIVCKVAGALAAGCTVVVKPSEITPLSAYLLLEILEAAGLPAGVVNLVPGLGPSVGEAIAGHPDIDVVSFTGSVRAGRRVAEVAAANITKVTLELGGKSAGVVLPDADLATAVKAGVANAFLNGGQTCAACTRMLVHESQYDEAVELAGAQAAKYQPGDPLEPATRLGPLASGAQRDRVREFITTGIAEGARVVTGGAEPPEGLERGYFVLPTVLADVRPEATVAQQEIFGPVLSLIRYSDEEEAVAIANDSDYGLAGAVWSADRARAVAFARRVRTGSVDVNGGGFNPAAPFGGYKRSGIGREMGVFGIEEFLEVKSIQL